MTTNQIKRFLGAAAFAFAASLFVAPAANAGGPLVLCQSGQPFLWPNGGTNIPFNPDQGDLGPVSGADAIALTQSAFDVWGAVPTSTASYTNAGLLPVDVDVTNFIPYLFAPAPDGLSAIVFDDTGEIFDLLFGAGSSVLGFAGPEWGNIATCEIVEGLSFLNGPAFGDLTAAFDIMVHEFGHFTNLAHTVVNGQLYIGLGDSSGPGSFNPYPIPDPLIADVVETMYPFYFGPGIGTGSLHADDVASLSTLYPDPSFAATTGAISGTILAPDGVFRLTGVNVIARNEAAPYTDAVSAISGDFTDDFSQADPVTGTYLIEGLTPGADYRVYIDRILAGGFSTPPLSPLPGPEEYFNGAGESNNLDSPDPVTDFVLVAPDTAGVDVILNIAAPGEPLPLSDDGSYELFLPFPYDLCGNSYHSVFVNANGNLTFGAPSSDFSESVGDMLFGPPRIAGVWDDLNPAAGGVVTYFQGMNFFEVIWEDVPEFGSSNSNSFSIRLKRSADHIDINIGELDLIDGLTGVSCGGADTSGFETASDLSRLRNRRANLHNQPAIYEVFGGGSENDLAESTVLFSGSTSYKDKYEPNESLAEAHPIPLPFDTIDIANFTEISPTGNDVDYFSFEARGETTLVAEVLNGRLDTVLGLFDASGNLIAVDDDGGAGLLSRIVYPIPADGQYFLAVSTFPDFDFDGDGSSGGRYVLAVFTTTRTLLSLGDDDSVEVPLDFAFPYQGANWNSVWVNSNGNLTFGSGDADFSESVSELLADQPRIAPLWDDLAPNQGGLVLLESGATWATVSFIGVPEFAAANSNSFSVTLSDTGAVNISYGPVAAQDGIVGVSEGGGAADPGETDFSAGGPFSAAGTTYEQFGAGDAFDLDGTTLDFQ